jgi:hypothetical protein
MATPCWNRPCPVGRETGHGTITAGAWCWSSSSLISSPGTLGGRSRSSRPRWTLSRTRSAASSSTAGGAGQVALPGLVALAHCWVVAQPLCPFRGNGRGTSWPGCHRGRGPFSLRSQALVLGAGPAGCFTADLVPAPPIAACYSLPFPPANGWRHPALAQLFKAVCQRTAGRGLKEAFLSAHCGQPRPT